MNLPYVVTFTGVDDHTNLDQLRRIARAYPALTEWGVLHSTRVRERYPSAETIDRLRDSGLRLSAHLCGAFSRRIMVAQDYTLPNLLGFTRVQVNHRAPNRLVGANYSQNLGLPVILQSRNSLRFPDDKRVQWLFDKSGGRGTAPSRWPEESTGQYVGYSGGLGPDNVVEAVKKMGAGNFWIDMESGVRTDDLFDTEKCWAVMEAIFG